MTDSTDRSPRRLFAALALLVAVATAGCGAPAREVLSQGQGPTMDEILRGERAEAPGRAVRETRRENALRASENAVGRLYPRYESYTRDALNEINQLFPRHRNPQLVLYVHPHLATRDNAPVPGYSTAFSLYETEQYALPSEIPPSYLPRTSAPTGERADEVAIGRGVVRDGSGRALRGGRP